MGRNGDTITEHRDAAVYRRYFAGISAGDLDVVAPLLSDDVVWRAPGGAAMFEGREAVLRQMAFVVHNHDVRLHLHDVVASDDHTIALVHWSVRAGKHELNYPAVEVWHVHDGQVKERWLYTDDPDAIMTWPGWSSR